MLSDPGSRILIPARAASQAALTRAQDAVASIDVLTAESEADAAEAYAKAIRAGLKVQATDMALLGIVERLQQGKGTIEDLLRVVGALDPDKVEGAGGGTVVAVEVIVRNER